MNIVSENLEAVLGLRKKEHLAIVGAGGKTSLMHALAGRLRRKRTILSTTTKMHYDEVFGLKRNVVTLRESDWKERLENCLKEKEQAFLISKILNSGKVEGIPPSLADEIFKGQDTDFLLLEADGAAGRPVKAPLKTEPVIPHSATTVIAMMGLDAMDGHFDQATVFREREFLDLTGIEPGEELIPERLSLLFIDQKGLFQHTPVFCKKIVFLNRQDLLSDKHQAYRLAELIARAGVGVDRIVIGSIKENKYDLSGR